MVFSANFEINLYYLENVAISVLKVTPKLRYVWSVIPVVG